MFDQETADAIFDKFMLGQAQEGALFADFITMLNMKAASYVDNKDKMELLTEILNDAKLFIAPMENDMPH